MAKIIRHVAQNNAPPLFVDFAERDTYDLDRLARELLNTPPVEANVILTNMFKDAGKQWKFFYKNYANFRSAYNKAVDRIFLQPDDFEVKPNDEPVSELTDIVRGQTFARDGFKCLCYGKEQRKGVSLQIDHIIPVAMGGTNEISNLQTLCKHCNTVKGVNEIDYRVNVTPRKKPKDVLRMIDPAGSDDIVNAIARMINEFYHCKATCAVFCDERKRGRFYHKWEIVLFRGNDPEWLRPYEARLIEYIRKNCGWAGVEKISIHD